MIFNNHLCEMILVTVSLRLYLYLWQSFWFNKVGNVVHFTGQGYLFLPIFEDNTEMIILYLKYN